MLKILFGNVNNTCAPQCVCVAGILVIDDNVDADVDDKQVKYILVF